MKLNKDLLLKWHTIFSDNYGSFITNVYNTNLSPHPLIIFYDEYNQRVYYLKGQTFKNQWFYNNNESYFYKIEIKGDEEQFQPNPNIYNPYVYKTTLFDTSTIYQMDLEEFIEQFEPSEENSYIKIKPEHQHNILKNLYFNHKNNDIALKIVNVVPTIIDDVQSIVSESYYSYVSKKYLIRNLGYKKRTINSFDLDSLIKEFDLDVRIKPLSYNGIGGIINSAFFDFKDRFPKFANEVNKLYDNERKKGKRTK